MERNEMVFAHFLEEMRIPMHPIDLPVRQVEQFPDLGLRSTLLGAKSSFTETLPDTSDDSGKTYVWFLQDRYCCRYFLGKSRGKYWLAGPYMIGEISMHDLARLYTKLGMSNANTDYLRLYYLSVPKLHDENMLDALIRAHLITAYGADGFEIGYQEMEVQDRPVIAEAVQQAAYPREHMEKRYAREKIMMECIKQGNYAGAHAALSKLRLYGQESRSSSTLRDGKNFCITFNTLCRIAARDGGVPAVEIDNLSKEISLQIENILSMKELTSLADEVLKRYCQLAMQSQQERYTPLVSHAVSIIKTSFAADLSLQGVASQLNVSAGYLSVLLKQETGKSFSDILAEKRINYAKLLLSHTELPIAALCVECGIPDNNYFSRFFKQHVGMTPRQFRFENSTLKT